LLAEAYEAQTDVKFIEANALVLLVANTVLLTLFGVQSPILFIDLHQWFESPLMILQPKIFDEGLIDT
jgi:hypothetical protein